MKRSLMTRNAGFTAIIFFMAMAFFACQSGSDLKETETGVKIKFHVKNDDSVQVNKYDIVHVLMTYRTKDSVLMEGGKNKFPFQVNPVYDGDLMDGILLMHKGDSATIVLNAEDFFTKMMQYPSVQPGMEPEDDIFFDIKVVDVTPEPEMVKAERLEGEARKANETENIKRYISENNITVEPTESGLYYVQVQAGDGKQAAAGKKVKVHYKGTFLDGEKFDSSYDRNAPIEFVLGQGQVIKGWDEGISMMKEGEKALMVIPSEIAYGSQKRGNIKAYTPLVFDVELIEVVD